MPKKTVYILGAGFSIPAGGPKQAELLGKLINREHDDSYTKAKKFAVLEFLTSTLGIHKEKLAHSILEDVYTPIDRCIADGVSLKGKTPSELATIRDNLDYLIASEIKIGFEENKKDGAYISKFAKYLVSLASERAVLASRTNCARDVKSYDPFSIISLNWDIALDNALYSELRSKDALLGSDDYDPFGVVDYCCYVSSLDRLEKTIRTGLWSLGCKGYNVKLLKIHGSLNWLQCTNCQRLYTAFRDKVALSNIGALCAHCLENDIRTMLRSTLIMPTFLKDLRNFQIQLVWQNAGVELMEARKLVFIGYSLPDADFEFRQLLTRMVHPKAEIEVVLWRDETYEESKSRYERFFSGHTPKIGEKGVEDYVDRNCIL